MAAEKGYKQGRFDAIAGQLFRKQFEKIIVYKLIEAIEAHTKQIGESMEERKNDAF